MTQSKIHEIAETYINGNISDAKKAVKKMSKGDFLDLLEEIVGLNDGMYGRGLLTIGRKLIR